MAVCQKEYAVSRSWKSFETNNISLCGKTVMILTKRKKKESFIHLKTGDEDPCHTISKEAYILLHLVEAFSFFIVSPMNKTFHSRLYIAQNP